MAQTDAAFVGSIPQIYQECLVPVLFEPFARDLAARARALAPSDILEVAAGTGVVTRHLAKDLPSGRIAATDLNPGMIAIAANLTSPNVSWSVADALDLPFADGSFDLVVSQFGAMFYPDRVKAYREARRVLRPGGQLLFNVWDRLEANSGSYAVHHALRAALPDPKPDFIVRTPFGYYDRAVIEADLKAAGFGQIAIDVVQRESPPGSAVQLARGLCLGSPLAGELSKHSEDLQRQALKAAIDAVEKAEAIKPLAMSALVVTAGG